MNRTALLVTVLVLAVGTVLGVVWVNRAKIVPVNGPVTIQRAAPQSFGLLSTETVTQRSTTRDSATPATTESSGATGIGVGEPGPTFAGFRYVYRGAAVPLREATVDVLERSVDAASLNVGDYGLGLFTPGSFPNAAVQSLTVAQADGYTVYVDAVNGTANISEVNPVGVVRDFPVNGAALSVPDSQLIGIANAFLAEHGVDRSVYGDPVVTTFNGGVPVAFPGMEGGLVKPDLAWSVPSTLTYPMRIEGLDAVGYGGEPFGLTVSIDAQRQRVSAVYNLTVQRYRASAYAAVTDFATMQAVAERGGIYGSTSPSGEGVGELTLGTPNRVWLTLSRFDGTRSHELLVPAFRFPVENPPAGYASAVVVPLAKDLLTSEEIKPVPLPAEGSSTPGVPTR